PPFQARPIRDGRKSCAGAPVASGAGPRGAVARLVGWAWRSTTGRPRLLHQGLQEGKRVDAVGVPAFESDLQCVLTDETHVADPKLRIAECFHARQAARHSGFTATLGAGAGPPQLLARVGRLRAVLPRDLHDLTFAVDVDVRGKWIGVLQALYLVDVEHRKLTERLDRRACCDLRRDRYECLRTRRLRPRDDDRCAPVGVLANSFLERDGAEEGNAESLRRRLRAAVAEDLVAVPALGAHVPAHVLD